MFGRRCYTLQHHSHEENHVLQLLNRYQHHVSWNLYDWIEIFSTETLFPHMSRMLEHSCSETAINPSIITSTQTNYYEINWDLCALCGRCRHRHLYKGYKAQVHDTHIVHGVNRQYSLPFSINTIAHFTIVTHANRYRIGIQWVLHVVDCCGGFHFISHYLFIFLSFIISNSTG